MFDQDNLLLKDTAKLPDFPVKNEKFRINLIQATEEFEALKVNWEKLFELASPKSIFLTWEWLFTWWCHFGTGNKLLLITVWNLQNQLVGVAPFYYRIKGCLLPDKSIHFLGNNAVASDFLDFLIVADNRQEIFGQITQYLEKLEWDYLELNDLATNSETLIWLNEWCQQKKYRFFKIHDEFCPYISLTQSYEDYLAGLGKRTRRNIRNFERRLEKDFQVKFNLWQQNSLPDNLIEATVQLHELRQKNKGQYSPFLETDIQSFHRDLVARLVQKRAIVFNFLTCGEKIIGILYLFDDRENFYLYQGGYDPQFIPSSLNITQVMIAQTIKFAIENGRHSYQLLRGQNDLKKSFSTQFLINSTILMSRTASGRLEILKRSCRKKCKAIMKFIIPSSYRERLKLLYLKNK